MRKRAMRIRCILAVALVVMVLAPLTQTAHADKLNPWTEQLTNQLGNHVVTHVDGSAVTAVSCGQFAGQVPVSAQQYDQAARPVGAVYTSPTRFCGAQSAAGRNGVLYGYGEAAKGSAMYVQAYGYGYPYWRIELSSKCPTTTNLSYPSVSNMTLGGDGGLYVLAWGDVCSAFGTVKQQSYLYGMNASTGKVNFKVGLGGSGYYSPPDSSYYGVQAYKGGLIVRFSKTQFRYFSYKGVENPTLKYTQALSASEDVPRRWHVNLEGNLFLRITESLTNRTGPCTVSTITSKIVKRELAGPVRTYSTRAACALADDMEVLPNGGAAFTYDTRPPTEWQKPSVLLLSPTGVVTTRALTVLSGLMYDASAVITLDAGINGNMLVTFAAYIAFPASAPQYFTEMLVLGSDGTVLSRARTTPPIKQGMGSDQTGNPAEDITVYPTLGMTNGAIYGVNCFNNYDAPYLCQNRPLKQLRKFAFADVSLDYPRAALANMATPVAARFQHVALGDSYSSGEGVEPFDADSKTATNSCHRSSLGYPYLLNMDVTQRVVLQKFVACSGAKTENITTTKQYGTGPQVNAIDKNTNVVTLTIGGNDVAFVDLVKACLFPAAITKGCSASTPAYKNTLNLIRQALPGKLKSTYQAIQARLNQTGSKATVLVVGYPFMIREGGQSGLCPVELSQVEQRDAGAITIALDQAISTAVVQLKDSRFRYVDPLLGSSPFTGHDMCSIDPYFNNYVAGKDILYTAHPNRKGLQAYEDLISAAVTIYTK